MFQNSKYIGQIGSEVVTSS